MRVLLFITLVFVASFTASASGATKTGGGRYLVPEKNGVPVYAGKTRHRQEIPLFKVDRNDHLTQLSESRDRYRIRNSKGKTGWILKTDVKKVNASRAFVFDNAAVQGYLDNPTPVYIIDADDPNETSITLDHSFSDALRRNIDKFTAERIAARNRKNDGTLPF